MLVNTLMGSIVRIVAMGSLCRFGVGAYIYAVIAGSIFTIILNFRTISKLTGISIDMGNGF